MDFFTYTTRSAKIDSISLIKDLEQEIRDLYYKVIQDIYQVSEKSKDEVLHPFILFTKALAKFEFKSSRRLPDFVYNARKEGAHTVVYFLTTTNTKLEYDEYLTLFSYMNNTPIILPSVNNNNSLGLQSGVLSLIYLANIIKNNPNPYTFLYTRITSSELYRVILNYNINKSALLHGIALRQNLFNDDAYTVIEDYIYYYKNAISTWNNLDEELNTKASQILNATIEYSEMTKNDRTTDTEANPRLSWVNRCIYN